MIVLKSRELLTIKLSELLNTTTLRAPNQKSNMDGSKKVNIKSFTFLT